jgi:hypothetical protein
LRDRLRFVVAHLVVHAGAIFEHDVGGRAALIVRDALIDPFDVVGGGGAGASRAHLNGKVAAALMEKVKAGDLFAKPPEIHKLEILAHKLPK